MFTIIEPNQHNQYREHIQELHWNSFSRYWLYIPETDKRKATYFIALDGENKYIGGAWLIKKSARKFLKDTGLASPHLKKCVSIWELSGIHTCLKTGNDAAPLRSFYQAMYQQLVAYTQKQCIEYVLVHTSAAERRNLQSFGKWPVVGYLINPREYTMAYSFLALSAVSARAMVGQTI